MGSSKVKALTGLQADDVPGILALLCDIVVKRETASLQRLFPYLNVHRVAKAAMWAPTPAAHARVDPGKENLKCRTSTAMPRVAKWKSR